MKSCLAILIITLSSLTAYSAEPKVITVRHPDGKPWKVGDPVCLGRSAETLKCGKVISTTDTDAYVSMDLSKTGAALLHPGAAKKLKQRTPAKIVPKY